MLFGRLNIFGVLTLVVMCSCRGQVEGEIGRPLRLAVTTSTRDSGLLDALLPDAERELGFPIQVIAVGSGAALKLAAAGDVDAVIAHSEAAEDQFMNQGLGKRREFLMKNSYLLLGPPQDPAGIRGAVPNDAMQRIARSGACFVSRGDDSGTHARERALWKLAGGRPKWSEYLEAGQGQASTILMADEWDGYVISDRGTFLKLKDRLRLVPLVTSGEGLENPYHAIVVSGKNHPQVNQLGAEALVNYLTSEFAQMQIAKFRIGGSSAFFPGRAMGDGPRPPD